jgi:hypothetical protein
MFCMIIAIVITALHDNSLLLNSRAHAEPWWTGQAGSIVAAALIGSLSSLLVTTISQWSQRKTTQLQIDASMNQIEFRARTELIWRQQFEELHQLQKYLEELLVHLSRSFHDRSSLDTEGIVEVCTRITSLIPVADTDAQQLLSYVTDALDCALAADHHKLAEVFTKMKSASETYVRTRRLSLIEQTIHLSLESRPRNSGQ